MLSQLVIMKGRVFLVLKGLVLVLFVAFSGLLLSSQWLAANEMASIAAVTTSATIENSAAVTPLASEPKRSVFTSGSALAIVLVVIALVAVARRESRKSVGR